MKLIVPTYETICSNCMKLSVSSGMKPMVSRCGTESFLGVKLNSSYRADWFHIPVLLSDIMTVLPDGASENPC